MSVKKKGNFDIQRQRGLRGKTGISGQRYGDSVDIDKVKKVATHNKEEVNK